MQEETGLPPNWEVRHSNSKNLPYYFNSAEKSSRWEPPAGTDTDKLKSYMAKYHSGSMSVRGRPARQDPRRPPAGETPREPPAHELGER